MKNYFIMIKKQTKRAIVKEKRLVGFIPCLCEKGRAILDIRCD
jgi:hypothetical protein